MLKNKSILLIACAAVFCSSPVLAEDTGIVNTDVLNVRSGPSTNNSIVGRLSQGDEVTITGEVGSDWYMIDHETGSAFVSGDYIDLKESGTVTASKEGAVTLAGNEELTGSVSTWDGPVLTPSAGVVMGPSGKETYYNLDMSGIVEIMRGMGNTDEYWIREDGCKMLGDYIMCAANLNVHPRGTLVESSLGTCIVCDTGGFAASNPNQLDIAVNW